MPPAINTKGRSDSSLRPALPPGSSISIVPDFSLSTTCIAYEFCSDAPICNSKISLLLGFDAIENGRLSSSAMTTIRYCPAWNSTFCSGFNFTLNTVSVYDSNNVTSHLILNIHSLSISDKLEFL